MRAASSWRVVARIRATIYMRWLASATSSWRELILLHRGPPRWRGITRVSLVRPRGLTGRQWRALQKGLSWHRAGRSISVRLWMQRLMRERVEERFGDAVARTPQSDRVQSKIPWRAAAVFLVVALTIATVLAQRRSTFPLKAIAAPSPLLSAAADPEVASAPALAPVSPNEQQPATDLVAQASVPARKDIAYTAPQIKAAARATPAFSISVEPSQVRSDDHFAEIRLRRNVLQKDSPFTWWTEPATAKPNVDYVPEAVAIQTFPAAIARRACTSGYCRSHCDRSALISTSRSLNPVFIKRRTP